MKYKIKEYSFGRIEDREILNLKDSVSLHHFFYSENSITTISIPVRFHQKKHYDSTIVIPFGNNDTSLKYINIKGDSSVIFKYKGYNSYTFDSLGRLVAYSYSSCFECGRSPYDGFIYYDKKDRIQTILNTHFYKGRADFKYSPKGRLKKIRVYEGLKKGKISWHLRFHICLEVSNKTLHPAVPARFKVRLTLRYLFSTQRSQAGPQNIRLILKRIPGTWSQRSLLQAKSATEPCAPCEPLCTLR